MRSCLRLDRRRGQAGCRHHRLVHRCANGDHFAPRSASFMVNYQVIDLHHLVKVLKGEGCSMLEKLEDSEYGKFAWVLDPEGNMIELWQPPQGQ